MHRFRNILFVCDEHSAHEQAFERVCQLASSNDVSVTLVDTIDSGGTHDLSSLFATIPGLGSEDIGEAVLNVHRNKLETHADKLRKRGISTETDVLIGTPFIEIIRQVLRNQHDLVIKGAHRAAGRPSFPGADMHLLRKCPCPVWVLNSASEPNSRRILAAVDPDDTDTARAHLNREILELATSLARCDGAKLDVVNVWNLPEESALRNGMTKIPNDDIDRLVAREQSASEKRLQALISEFSGHSDVMRALHLKGIAADVITEHVSAEGIDTIVMGTLARTGVPGLFIGNTAETILNHVTCSVLTVKAQGFVSPIGPGAEGRRV